MLIFPGMLSTPAGLLLAVGGAMTLIASVLMALDQFRDAAAHSVPDPESGPARETPSDNASARPRSFIFIGFFAFPVSFGGFWGGGPRRRALGALYMIGFLLAAAGALLFLLT